jgi:hypothetical protein
VRFSACTLSYQRSRDLSSLSPITYPARSPAPCSLPSLTKTSFPFPFQNSLQNPSPSDPLQIQIYFLQRVCPPNPHLLLLDGPFPSSIFMRSVFPANCPPTAGAITPFLVHTSYIWPCRRPTCLPVHLHHHRPPSHHMLSCRSRSQQFVASPTSFFSNIYPPLPPFFNLNSVHLALSVAALRVHSCTFTCCSALSFILLCPAIKHYPSQPLRETRYYLYLEDPFIPFCLMQARRPAWALQQSLNGKFIAACN